MCLCGVGVLQKGNCSSKTFGVTAGVTLGNVILSIFFF